MSINWIRLGQTDRDAPPADPVFEEMAGMTRCFRDLLRKDPAAFDCTVRLKGFLPVRLTFRALCQTVALVLIHPRTAAGPAPDVTCLLVNGVEMPEDIATVTAQVDFPAGIWQLLEGAPKPVTLAAFNVNCRMRDPATTTVIHVVGNVYFKLFGTNDIVDQG
ncbi:MAG TPA: hypothetical protein VGI81_15920 [Tepidisphaeraceae bacterium]